MNKTNFNSNKMNYKNRYKKKRKLHNKAIFRHNKNKNYYKIKNNNNKKIFNKNKIIKSISPKKKS